MSLLSVRCCWQPSGRPSSGSGLLCRQSVVITTFLANQPAHWLKQALAAARQAPTDPVSELSVQHAASDEQAKAGRLVEAWTAAQELGTSAPSPENMDALCSSLRGRLTSAALAQGICSVLQVSIFPFKHLQSAFAGQAAQAYRPNNIYIYLQPHGGLWFCLPGLSVNSRGQAGLFLSTLPMVKCQQAIASAVQASVPLTCSSAAVP